MLPQKYFNAWLYFGIFLVVTSLMGVFFSTIITGSVYKSTVFELDRCQTRKDSYSILPRDYEFSSEYADLLIANQWACLEIFLIGYNLVILFWRAIGVSTPTDDEIYAERTIDYFKKHRIYTTFTGLLVAALFGLLSYYVGIIANLTQLRQDGFYIWSYGILSVYFLMVFMFVLLPIIGLVCHCYNEQSHFVVDRREGSFLRTVI